MSELNQAEGGFNLPLPLCSIDARNELDDAHPQWGESSIYISQFTNSNVNLPPETAS